MVRYNSTIERDLLYFLEYRQSVIWYQEQPITIEWQQPDGQIRHYTPDYEIHEVYTKFIAECKPEEKVQGSHAKQQRQIGEAWCEANEYHFVTYTDTALRAGHTLENLKLLWRYARLRDTHAIRKRILEGTRLSSGPVTLNQLCEGLAMPQQEIIPAVCHLLFHHELYMDMNQPFSVATTIWCREQNHGAD
jgi:hypothetical protein